MAKYHIEIDHAARLNRIAVLEPLSVDTIKEMLTTLWSSPGFDPAYATLQEETRSGLETPDSAAIEALHDFIETSDPRQGPVAIVVGDHRIRAGIGKFIEVKREFRGPTRQRELRHFARAEEALRWLKEQQAKGP